MHQFQLDLAGAMKWASAHHDELKLKFLQLIPKIPSFGTEVDNKVSGYVFFLANSVRALVCWSFEGKRYFGDKGLEVQKTR